MGAANASATRVARFTHNKVSNGFKRVQRWVFDLDSEICQGQLAQDLQNYKSTNDSHAWDVFAQEQANDIEGWQ